jgi:hypothetical protein
VANLPGVNNPPVITSSPGTQINENTNYAYQVTATDAEGNFLVYAAVFPSWLSIDVMTGLISGTAPNVNVDTNFSVTVFVSDGVNEVNQTYVLTVKDISGGGGGGGSGSRAIRGGASTGFASDLSFENQNYLNQFAPKTTLEEETPMTQTGKSLSSILLGIFALLSVSIIIVLAVVLVKRFVQVKL